MNHVVHSPEQLMAWKLADLASPVGKHVSIRVAADHSYWKNPHTYDGPWEHLYSGVVANAEMWHNNENARLFYTDGNWAGWIAGQPVYVTVTDLADTPTP